MTGRIRGYLSWGVARGLLLVDRTPLDWFVPTADFQMRAAATTYSIAGLLLVVGAMATWRSGSVVTGASAAGAISLVAAVCSAVGVVVMLGMFDGETTHVAHRSERRTR